MTCKSVLNELTRKEIEEIQSSIQPTNKQCPQCGKFGKMRKNQMFCSTRCKNEYHRTASRLLYDELVRLKKQFSHDQLELRKEIYELQQENMRLREQIRRLIE